MDDIVKVPRGAIFEFTKGYHTTVSRMGDSYIGFEMKEGVVIVCKDNDSNFTSRLIAGFKSEGALVVQVKCDEGHIKEGKLFARIDVKSRKAAEDMITNLRSLDARKVMRKLVVDMAPGARQGDTNFQVVEGRVYVNRKGRGKSLSEVTLNWIQSKLEG